MTETETKLRRGLARYAQAMTVTRPPLDDLLSRPDAETPEPERESGSRAPAGLVRGPRGVRRSLLVGVGAIAAATVLVVGITVLRPGDGDGIGTGTGVVARVIASTEQAMADSVMYMHRVNPDGSSEELWLDESGVEVDDRGMVLDAPAGRYRYVIYDENGAVLYEGGGAVVPPEAGSDPSARWIAHCQPVYVEGDWGLSGYYGSDPSWIVDSLERGLLVEDDTEVVDGRELIRLRHREDPPGEGSLLVDPDTYLLSVVTQGGLSGRSTETYEYLPRTPENLETLAMPAIPAGYTEVDVDSFPNVVDDRRPC